MTVYLALWAAVYAAFIVVIGVRVLPPRVITVPLLLTFGFFAAVRGDVGTDTVVVYQSIAQNLLSDGFGATAIEPGFRALLYGLVNMTASPELAVRGIAVLFTMLLLRFAVGANKAENWYLFALFIPASFFQLAFNVERTGIATAVLLLALQEYRLGKSRRSAVLSWGSVLFQYSSLVILAYVFLVENKLRTRRFAAVAVTVTSAVALFVFIADAYVSQKYNLYVESGYESPTALSGLSRVVVIFVILAGLRCFRMKEQLWRRMFWITLVFCAIFWAIARYSYAGLRLLDLVAFALPYVLLRAMARGDAALTGRAKVVYVVAGVIGAAFFFRNMLVEPTAAVSPFLPYRFLWQ